MKSCFTFEAKNILKMVKFKAHFSKVAAPSISVTQTITEPPAIETIFQKMF